MPPPFPAICPQFTWCAAAGLNDSAWTAWVVKELLHADVADVAVQVFNDMSMNGSVERRQAAVAACQLVQYRGVSRVDWTRQDVHHHVHHQNQRHYLHQSMSRATAVIQHHHLIIIIIEGFNVVGETK